MATRGDLTLALVTTALVAIPQALVIAAQARTTPSRDISITVNEGRPLVAIIEQLEKTYGWVVTYEDPAYVDQSEIDDVTATVSKDPHPARRVLVPRGRKFAFEYHLPDSPQQQAQDALTSLVQQYNRTLGGDVFEVRPDSQVYHIVPRMMRGPNGVLQPYRSILDTQVSVPIADRSALDMVVAVVDAVNAAGEKRLGMGVVTAGSLRTTKVHDGADSETARSVLVRTLRATTQKVSWVLLCSPGQDEACFLSLLPVPSVSGGREQP